MSNPETAQIKLPEAETTRPNHHHIANQFSEITKLLGGGKPQTFNDIERNYARDVCEWIDSFIEFVGNKSHRMEVIAFFESFETTSKIERKDIIQFIEMINALEDSEEEIHAIIERNESKKYRKVEMLRAIFAAFGLLHTDIIAGEEKPPTNPLINLYSNYIESSGGYTGRLYVDNDALVYFTPDADLSGQLFTQLKGPIKQECITLTLIVNVVSEEVDIVLSGESRSGSEGDLDMKGKAEREGIPGSDARKGRFNRRARNGEIKAEKEAQKTKQKNQEWYNGEFEKLRAFSLFLDERFEELRNFLLENVPYVNEVLDYIFTVNRLKEKGYERTSLNINEVRGEFEKLIHDYKRAIRSKEEENTRLKKSIATLADRLVNEDGSERSKLNKSIGKAQGKIKRNDADITTYSREITSLQDEAKDLFNNSTKYRLDQVPNREQFSLTFYHSLQAGEFYSSPDYINESPITEEWIRENILTLFIDILGTHLDEYHGVNIRDLSELQRKINELPEEYSDDIELPDIESVSQRKVSDFFEMLYPIIPRDYLSEMPNLPTIVTPESSPEIKIVEIKERKQRKSQSELRKESHAKKIIKEEARTKLIEELHRKEEGLMEYVQYWKEKLVSNIRTRRAYFADIESLRHSIPGRRKYPTKGIDELEMFIQENKKDEEMIREKIENGGLKTDEIAYKSLMEDRAQIARKLSHLKR